MRLVFAGTPEVAVPSMQAILHSGRHEILAVITRPDAPTGRGRKLTRSPVAEAALAAGLPVLTPQTLRDPEIQQQLSALAPEAAPVVAYGNLVPPALLALPRHGWINLHFSLLPAWRGAAPVNAALAAGDDISGASTFRLDEGLDTGPVFGTVTERISDHDTAGSLLGRLSLSGAELLLATLDGIAAGTLIPLPQPGEGISYAGKLSVEHARIRWAAPALAVYRQIRSVTPAPGAWTSLQGERVKIGSVCLAELEAKHALQELPYLVPGELSWTRRALFVGTASGAIEIERLQPHGKKMMAAMDWVRGARLQPPVSFA